MTNGMMQFFCGLKWGKFTIILDIYTNYLINIILDLCILIAGGYALWRNSVLSKPETKLDGYNFTSKSWMFIFLTARTFHLGLRVCFPPPQNHGPCCIELGGIDGH